VFLKWFLIADVANTTSVEDSWLLATMKTDILAEFRYGILTVQGYGRRAVLPPLDGALELEWPKISAGEVSVESESLLNHSSLLGKSSSDRWRCGPRIG
jgi:hypothetical protein